MNREQIIQMAKQAHDETGGDYDCDKSWIERFAALIAAHEREQCAKVCETNRDLHEEARAALRVADAFKDCDDDTMLRALRHESEVRLYNGGIDKCVAAIRARGQQ